MHPLFTEGEEVILKSVMFPECNGDATVLEVVACSDFSFKYKLDIEHKAEGFSEYWLETALRKKHTPGDMNFTDLMASLSSPKLITHQP